MKPGFDFVKQLDIQVPQSDVVLAIIGTNWTPMMTNASAASTARMTMFVSN